MKRHCIKIQFLWENDEGKKYGMTLTKLFYLAMHFCFILVKTDMQQNKLKFCIQINVCVLQIIFED